MDRLNVIIPVYKPGKEFGTLINRINKQTIAPEKIILMWTIPSGTTLEDAKRDSHSYISNNVIIEYVEQKDFDHGGTRKLAMSISKSEYVVCMTQDAMPLNEHLFEYLINEFGDTNVAACYARQVADHTISLAERITRKFNYPVNERVQNKSTLNQYGIKTYFCSDVCAMYRKSYYEQVGGFVEKTIFNEDMIMAANLIDNDYTVKYVPKAKVLHAHNYSYMQQLRRNFDLAVSHKQYSDIFNRVSSESEGIKLVKMSMKKLIKVGRPYLIPDLILQSGFKYMGYFIGKRYNRLPRFIVKKLTMNKLYWS